MKVLNNDRDETVRFRIEPRIGDDGIYLELKENGNRATTVFPPDDAPALALAILEAAGYKIAQRGDMDTVQIHVDAAIYELGCAREAQERISAEARERAELEAEALALHNAWREQNDMDFIHDFEPLKLAGFDHMWLAVARRAREMRAEK